MSKQMARPQTKQDRRRDRREEHRRKEEAHRRAARTRGIVTISIIAVLVLAVGAFIASRFILPASSSASDTGKNGQTVDNISCDQGEHSDVHFHVHLSMYVNGSPVTLPQNVGIASDGSCLYWLHTHSTDGIIHIEAPKSQTYTLGNFLHIWNTKFQQLQYPIELDDSSGWIAYVDGKPYTGDFHTIQLKSHELITLAYNSPNVKPDTTFNWGDLQQ